MESQSIHKSILLKEIQDLLLPPFKESDSAVFVDFTFGGGGHTLSFLEAFKSMGLPHRVIAFDQDENAVELGKQRFQKWISSEELKIIHSPFSKASAYLENERVLGCLADLGVSSDQLEDDQRGLSFLRDGPLDMRLGLRAIQTCQEMLEKVSREKLEEVIHEYGEERYSKRIAQAIIYQRDNGNLPKTTKELVGVIVKAFPAHARKGRIHVATRTFQALRIWVNQEFEELDSLLETVILSVNPGGRVGVISFHSLEDRRVKLAFKDKKELWLKVNKKPIIAHPNEIRENPRARSAKLRIAQRIHLKGPVE